MGYRSEVMMMLKGPAIKEVKVLMDTAGIDLNEHWGETVIGGDERVKMPSCFGYGRDHNDQLTFVFHIDDVKWYESFPEVQAIEKMWQFASMIADRFGRSGCQPLDSELNGIFIRIGEEYEDVTVKAIGLDGYELAQVHRTIDFDHSFLGEQIDWSAEINRDRIEAAIQKMEERKCA